MAFLGEFRARRAARRDADTSSPSLSRRTLLLAGGAAGVAATLGCSDGRTPVSTPTGGEAGFPTLPEATVDQAVRRFGVGRYSQLSTSWEIINEGSRNRTFHLIDEPNGEHTRVNTDTATIDGYLKLNKPGNPSLTVVVDGTAVPQVDLIGGTFRNIEGQSSMQTVMDVWHAVAAKEPVEQPGVIFLPVGFRPEGCDASSTEVRITSAADAAARFGVDNWSSNPANWNVAYEDGDIIGLHLNVDGSGVTHRVGNLGGTFFEGYVDIKDAGEVPFFAQQGTGVRALTFVGNGTVVDAMDMRGGTIWIPKHAVSANDLNVRTIDLFRKVFEKERNEQPGTLVLPLGFNPTQPNVC